MAPATISSLLLLVLASGAIANQLTPKELFDAVPPNCRVVSRVESCEEISTCFATSTRVPVEGCDDIDITHWPTCIHTTVTHTKLPPKPTFHPTGNPEPPCEKCSKPEPYCLGNCPKPHPNPTEKPGPKPTGQPCNGPNCKPEPSCVGSQCPEPKPTEKPGPEPTEKPCNGLYCPEPKPTLQPCEGTHCPKPRPTEKPKSTEGPCQGPNCSEPPCAWPGCDPKPPQSTQQPYPTSTQEEDCESVYPSTKSYGVNIASSSATSIVSGSANLHSSSDGRKYSSAKTTSSYNPASTLIVSPNGRCGGKTGYTCKGSGYGECCGANNKCGNTAFSCGNACQPLAGTCPPYTPDGSCGNGCSCIGSPYGECCGPDFKCGSGQFACGTSCNFQWGVCNIMPGK